jgi:hypothetical protein
MVPLALPDVVHAEPKTDSVHSVNTRVKLPVDVPLVPAPVVALQFKLPALSVFHAQGPPLTVKLQLAARSVQWVCGSPADASAGRAANARAVSAAASTIIFLLMSTPFVDPAGKVRSPGSDLFRQIYLRIFD